MNTALAQKLCAINNRFYRENAASFSATRKSPWNGWRASWELVCASSSCFVQHATASAQCASNAAHCDALTILDLAAGNLRFEAYLAGELAPGVARFFAVDDCAELAPERSDTTYQNLDIVAALLENDVRSEHGDHDFKLAELIDAPSADLSVSFGFMHHIPTQTMRAHVLDALIAHTKPGGFIGVSFWEFMNNEALASKAHITHAQALKDLELSTSEQAQLEEGDFFLGWKDTTRSYRYCHNFTRSEIDDLLARCSASAKLIARFHADGRTNDLNEYIVLQRHK